MANASGSGTGGFVRGIPLNVTLHAWPVPRSDADIHRYNDTSSGIVRSHESAKNFTHSLHNLNATGYVAIDDYDLLDTGFSDVQTFILAGIATVTPLLLAFGTVMGLRYLWKKYFRSKTIAYRGVLQREENGGKVQSHSVPHELKTSESQFTMSPGDDPTSTSSTQPLTPKSNGSVITMTLRNNHLIVETEETDNTPAGVIIESQGPITKFVTSVPTQDLKLEQTKTDLSKEPSSTSPAGSSNDVLSPTDHGALVHRPPEETEDETDKGSCNTGLSQSDLSESSNESQNPSYQYGNQMGYNSGRYGYPEYSGYSTQAENEKFFNPQGPKEHRVYMRSSSVIEPASQGSQSKPPLLKDVLLSDIQAREKRMEEAEEKDDENGFRTQKYKEIRQKLNYNSNSKQRRHQEQQDLLKNGDFSVTGKAAGETIIEINKSSAAPETEQSPTSQLKTYLTEHAVNKELCDGK